MGVLGAKVSRKVVSPFKCLMVKDMTLATSLRSIGLTSFYIHFSHVYIFLRIVRSELAVSSAYFARRRRNTKKRGRMMRRRDGRELAKGSVKFKRSSISISICAPTSPNHSPSSPCPSILASAQHPCAPATDVNGNICRPTSPISSG